MKNRAVVEPVIICSFTHVALALFLCLFLQHVQIFGGTAMKLAIIFIALIILLEYWHNMFALIRIGDKLNHGTMKRLISSQKRSTMTAILAFTALIFVLLSSQVFYGVLGIVEIVIIILDGTLCSIALKLYGKLRIKAE